MIQVHARDPDAIIQDGKSFKMRDTDLCIDAEVDIADNEVRKQFETWGENNYRTVTY